MKPFNFIFMVTENEVEMFLKQLLLFTKISPLWNAYFTNGSSRQTIKVQTKYKD